MSFTGFVQGPVVAKVTVNGKEYELTDWVGSQCLGDDDAPCECPHDDIAEIEFTWCLVIDKDGQRTVAAFESREDAVRALLMFPDAQLVKSSVLGLFV